MVAKAEADSGAPLSPRENHIKQLLNCAFKILKLLKSNTKSTRPNNKWRFFYIINYLQWVSCTEITLKCNHVQLGIVSQCNMQCYILSNSTIGNKGGLSL